MSIVVGLHGADAREHVAAPRGTMSTPVWRVVRALRAHELLPLGGTMSPPGRAGSSLDLVISCCSSEGR
jgi:hypothetical protein